MAAAAAAVGIEMLEALAIVLAVGAARRFSDALLGAVAAILGVVCYVSVSGPPSWLTRTCTSCAF